MLRASLFWTALALGGLCSSSLAQTPTATSLHARSLASMCANCHGTEGRTVDGSAIPSLVGMPKNYMLMQLKAFKDGSRPATVMHQIVKGVSDTQVETIADYFASNKR